MPKSTKNAVGRPSKYSEDMPGKMRDVLAEGYSFGVACGAIDITRETGYEWINSKPGFSDAVRTGRAMGMALWEKRLANQAMTNPGNTAAIIFAMKNLYKDNWSDKIESEISGPGGTPIQANVAFSFIKADEKEEL